MPDSPYVYYLYTRWQPLVNTRRSTVYECKSECKLRSPPINKAVYPPRSLRNRASRPRGACPANISAASKPVHTWTRSRGTAAMPRTVVDTIAARQLFTKKVTNFLGRINQNQQA